MELFYNSPNSRVSYNAHCALKKDYVFNLHLSSLFFFTDDLELTLMDPNGFIHTYVDVYYSKSVSMKQYINSFESSIQKIGLYYDESDEIQLRVFSQKQHVYKTMTNCIRHPIFENYFNTVPSTITVDEHRRALPYIVSVHFLKVYESFQCGYTVDNKNELYTFFLWIFDNNITDVFDINTNSAICIIRQLLENSLADYKRIDGFNSKLTYCRFN